MASALVGGADDLAAVFAGVAGAADVAGDAVERGVGAGVVAHRREVAIDERRDEPHGARPLHGDHRRRGRHVVEPRGVVGQPPLEPIDDLRAVRGVDDDLKRRRVVVDRSVDREAIDEHVVEDAAAVVAHEAVADLPGPHVGDAAGDRGVEEAGRVGAEEPQPTHVRDVEHADRRARGQVFGGDRRVLDRHFPAGKVDHPPAVGDVPIEERGPGELGSHGHRRSVAGRMSKIRRSPDSTRGAPYSSGFRGDLSRGRRRARLAC